jgi:hypothetical protein
MKKTILLFTILFFSLNIVGQSKKEIIETLKSRIDSLHSEIKNCDINFEKAQALANSNKEALQLTISKLEQDIAFLKGQLDVTQKTNDKLVENNTQLNNRLAVLKDSVTFLQKNLAAKASLSSDSDFDKKVKAAFEKLKRNEILSYWLDSISLEKDIIKDSYNEVCNDNGECTSFVLTEQFLIVSYRANGPGPKEILIIDLNSGKNIINENESYLYVNGYDKEKGILKIETDGLDNNGRYWKEGTYNLKTKIRQLGKKEY